MKRLGEGLSTENWGREILRSEPYACYQVPTVGHHSVDEGEASGWSCAEASEAMEWQRHFEFVATPPLRRQAAF